MVSGSGVFKKIIYVNMPKYHPDETGKLKALSPKQREEICQKFRSLMIRQGIHSYRQIQERIRISGGGISAIFHGWFVPDSRTAARLSRELGIAPHQFYAILDLENSPRVQEAQEYYLSLDKDQTPPISLNIKMTEMDNLYQRSRARLNIVYEKGSIINKAKIIGGLEVLIGLYSR